MKIDVATFRFTPGRGVRGPDCYGCCGTGMAPVILRLSTIGTVGVGLKHKAGAFVVGPELAVDQAKRQYATYDGRRGSHYVSKEKHPRNRVWIYWTRGPAVRKFQALVAARIEENRQDAEDHRKAMRRAASDDPREAVAGALAANDYR